MFFSLSIFFSVPLVFPYFFFSHPIFFPVPGGKAGGGFQPDQSDATLVEIWPPTPYGSRQVPNVKGIGNLLPGIFLWGPTSLTYASRLRMGADALWEPTGRENDGR